MKRLYKIILMVYPVVVTQDIIYFGQAMPAVLQLFLSTSVLVCLIWDIRFIWKEIKALMGRR